MAPSAHTPSPSLLANFRQELVRFPPFAQMTAEDVDAFVAGARQQVQVRGVLLANTRMAKALAGG